MRDLMQDLASLFATALLIYAVLQAAPILEALLSHAVPA